MQTFAAAVDTLKKSCLEYENSLKKTVATNSELKNTIDKMSEALTEMKNLFKQDNKCGICCSRATDTALECGHTLCNVCSVRALRAERCPFCRRGVTESIKIYL